MKPELALLKKSYNLILAYEKLTVAYRLNKSPSDKILSILQNKRKIMKEIEKELKE